MSFSRDTLCSLINIQHDIFRLDEAIATLKDLIALGPELDERERSLFGLVYKDAVDPKRRTHKMLMSVFNYEERAQHAVLADRVREVREKSGVELSDLCKDAIALIESELYPKSVDASARVFFQKMRGDMYRYLAELEEDGARETALEAYTQALTIANESLADDDPVKLGTILNFAVFEFEHRSLVDRAIELVREGIQKAEAAIGHVEDASKSEAYAILSVMQSNLANWEEIEEYSDEGDDSGN
jgi:14-3-3 protein epsilon